MSMHPTPTAALADQHRRDLLARAENHRIARAARASRPAPARPTPIIPQLFAAARRPVTRLLAAKPPATARAGSGNGQ
jgi:hypothetical protein